jgi:AhpD family alkylhydroperoxidase
MKRFHLDKTLPGTYDAMDALDTLVAASPLEAPSRELIRVRTSQINGCSYCVDAHSHDALAAGEKIQRLLLLSAWKESGQIFNASERILLKMTEEITLIAEGGLSDETYNTAIELLGPQKTAAAMMTIIAMNAWNRIGVGTRMHPSVRKELL